MKILKKVILTLLSVMLFFTLMIGGTVFWTAKNPQQAWTIVEKYILPKDMSITWKEIELRTRYLDGLSFHLDFRVEVLHLKKKEPLTDFLVDSIHLESSVFPFAMTQKIVVHSLVFKSSEPLKLTLNSSKSEHRSNPFQNMKILFDAFTKFKNYVDLQSVDIRVKELRFEQSVGGSDSVSLIVTTDMKQKPKSIDFRFSLKSGDDLTAISSGKVVPVNTGENEFLLKGEVNAKNSTTKVSQNLEIKFLADSIVGFSEGYVLHKTTKANIRSNTVTELKMDSNGIDLNLTVMHLKGVSSKVIKLRSIIAHLDMSWMENPSDLSIIASIDILSFDAKLRGQLERTCECVLPNEITITLDGKLWFSNLFANDTKKNKVGDFTARIQSLSNKLFSLKAAAHVKIDKMQNDFLFIPSLDVNIQVYQFLRLAKILAKRGVLIQAPLDILDGTISLQVNGPMLWSTENYSVPLRAIVKLSSSSQLIDLKVDADLQLSENLKSAQIDADILINSLQLELPPLTPTQGKPRIIIDKRVLRKPEPPKHSDGFRLVLAYRLHTKEPGAIRLLSKFFKPYLPLSLDIWHSVEKENSGFIRIEEFDIVYLRRQVHVERMSIDLTDADKKIFTVDGRLSVKQTQYTVFIDIKGPTNKPNILLSSDPYLPRSEIISVLLYNRTSDQLAGSDAQTAGHVEAAIADRAIGLFGIWAFASTPIKSFSYNPATKIYTATIELADGVSTSIGTNWEEENQVALSRRVSRRWTVTAAWMPANEGEDERTKLVLQWERRF